MPALATLQKDFTPPESRIGDANAAYEYVYNCIQADLLRAKYRTWIQGNIDGNAPFPKQKAGLTNLNFRQGTAIITQFQLPYYDLLTEVPLLFEVETTFGNSEERSDWSQIISEEFHRMITSWEDWDETMQQVITQMLIHNIGHLYFENAVDWRPQPALMDEILVADQSPCRLSRLEAVVVRKGYMATELMDFISDEAIARKLGWNPEEVKKTVQDSYYSKGTNPPIVTNTYEYLQRKRRNGDIYFGTYECERAWTAHCAVREFDRNISDNIIRTDKQTDNFLYQSPAAFGAIDELICPFFYDLGNGTWHSGKGVGTDIFPYCQIFNNFRCREVDSGLIAASVLVQANEGSGVRAAQMLTLDNLKIIPEGVKFIDHTIGQNLSATIDVRRDMEEGMFRNIGGQMPKGSSDSARKGQKLGIMEMVQAAQIGKGKINQFYSYLDRLGRTMFRKAARPGQNARHPGSKEALEFQSRCVARGVPIRALQEIDFVKAYRSAGAGSAVNALISLETIKEIAPSLPEPGRLAWMRLYISRLLGTRTADMLVGEIKTSDKKTDEDWKAAMENQELRKGADGGKFFAPDQNHVIHARSHISDMSEHLQQMEQVAQQKELELEDLIPIYTHLEAGGPHAYEHLDTFKDDPIRAGDYRELKGAFAQISRMADQIKHNIEQMQEEQARKQAQQAQAGPQIDPEMLKHMSYKDSPESVKAQMEQFAGVPRAQGDLSVAEQNLILKQHAAELKAKKQEQGMVLDDVKTAQGVKAQAHDQLHDNARLQLDAAQAAHDRALAEKEANAPAKKT